MVVVFVDWNVDFTEIKDTIDPVDVAAHGLYPGEVVARALVGWAHHHSKEEGGVAVHTLKSWLDDCASYVIYDLVVEPLAMVQGDDALVADGCCPIDVITVSGRASLFMAGGGQRRAVILDR